MGWWCMNLVERDGIGYVVEEVGVEERMLNQVDSVYVVSVS